MLKYQQLVFTHDYDEISTYWVYFYILVCVK